MRNVCYEQEIPILRFVVAFMTRNGKKRLPICRFVFILLFLLLLFILKERHDRGKKSENEGMTKNFIYDLAKEKGGIMQSVILLFTKESYYDVILCQAR